MAELSKAIARLMDEQRRARLPQPVAAPAVQEAVDASRVQVAPGERTLATQFVRLFAAAPGAAGMDERSLSAAAMAAFRYVIERAVEEPRVRVFIPDLAHDGWESSGTVIQVLIRDRPHIVDTVRECLRDADCRVQRLIAPTFQIERDPRRAVLAIDTPGPVGPRETFVHVDVERHPEPQVIANLVADRLRDLILATEDDAGIRARLQEATADLRKGGLPHPWSSEAAEAVAFLTWLLDGNFVFLGARDYELSGKGLERLARVRPGSGLGILQSEDLSRYAQASPLSEALRRRMQEPPLLMLSKTNARSTVYRRDYMDYIGLKTLDGSGVVAGERRFLGLYTEAALAQPSSTIPLLRTKLATALESEGESAESRVGQRLIATFDALPRAEVLALSAEALCSHLRAVLAAPDRVNAQIDYHPDALDRGAVVLVTMPRDRFAREMFPRTEQRLVQVSGATAVLDRALHVADDHVRMHFYLAARADSVASFRPEELRGPVMELLRTWEDRLRDELRRLLPVHEIEAVVTRYGEALPDDYKTNRDTRKTARDILCLEEVRATGRAAIELSDDPTAPGRFGILELFHADSEFIIGEWIRSVGHLGLGVHTISEIKVQYGEERPSFIVALRVRDEHGPLDLERTGAATLQALRRLQAGTLRDDSLNALIPRAGLDWRQVDVLRACVAYAAQCGLAPSREVAEHALARHPQSARLLWEYFAAKFDPMDSAPPRDRETHVLSDVTRRFAESLRAGASDTELRCLRSLLDILAATTRTNYYLGAVSGSALDDPTLQAPALALAITPARLPGLSGRQPARETFVDGPLVLGLDVRDGGVARGDVRVHPTGEGLRAALVDDLDGQIPRSAAIVPDAAQAGFWVKGSGGPAHTEAAYRSFVGALLDVADNVLEGRPRTAPGIVAYDGLDSYRVVGPGEGTTGLLEAANDVARKRSLWLGSAFAALATRDDERSAATVTARAAWEAIRRHLAELDRDSEREEVSVTAIGDLGDLVLAHALLRSRRIRLRAGFDRRWIFLDPNPDMARAFAERERLLDDPLRAWNRYARETLGVDSGVYARSSKAIELHPATRDLLGLDAPTLSGDDIVAAILRLPTDVLLCTGSAGTYIRATHEGDTVPADRDNAAARIDAATLGAKVVVELSPGAFTPAARIDYAIAGGGITSVVNDLGADLQLRDRYVNVEIAVAAASEGPRLPSSERLPLTVEAKARNAEITLGRCRDRVRAISSDRIRSITMIDDYADAIALHERDTGLDRRRHLLPEREALRSRRGRFVGLTHPEAAALGANMKVALRHDIVASDIPDDGFYERYLRSYFPEVIDARCGPGVRSHRLRRPIIAAEIANSLVDIMGAAFVARVRRDTGAATETIVRAWTVAVELGGLRGLWREVAEADPALPLDAEARCWRQIEAGAERATRWLVRTQPGEAAASALFDTFALPVHEVGNVLEASLPAALANYTSVVIDEIAALGVPRALAQRVAFAARLSERLDIAAIALEHNLAPADVAVGYYRICDLLDLEWLERRVLEIIASDHWERRVILGLADDLMALRSDFSTAIFAANADAVDAEAAIDSYLVQNQFTLVRIGEIIDDVTTAPQVTLAALSVVVREITQLVRAAG